MKNKYTTPQLTVVEFHAEKGFAESCPTCFSVGIGTESDILEQFSAIQDLAGANSGGSGNQGGFGMGTYSGTDLTGLFSTGGGNGANGGYFGSGF